MLLLLRQGKVSAAGELVEACTNSLSRVRVHLAQGDPGQVLAALAPVRRRAEAGSLWAVRRQVMLLHPPLTR